VREVTVADHAAAHAVVRAAFGRDTEADLVTALRADPAHRPALELVAVDGDEIVGHVMLTAATIDGAGEALALAPLAVVPSRQGRGLGAALVREVLARAAAPANRPPTEIVVVLGDPRYYGRFGFRPAAELGLAAPVPSWGSAFQARMLPLAEPFRTVRYAPPFDEV
jgi:putative acetyltransferase